MTPDRIALDSHGRIDDVFINCEGVHLERMDEHWFCLIVHRGDDLLQFTFHAERPGKALVSLEDEEEAEAMGVPILPK